MSTTDQQHYDLIDVGANLGHPSFRDDFDEVIARAKLAGISKMIVTGTSEQISKEAKEISHRHRGFLYFTAGIHPHDAKDFNDNTIDVLKDLYKEDQCVAVGECGLDYNRNFSPPDQQRYVFEEQVKLACEIKKPLFLHQRDAHADFLSILSRYKKILPPVVVHCFTGSADEAIEYINKGFYIGLTGFLWKDRSNDGIKSALTGRMIPLDRLVLETDAPFLFPKIDDKKIPKAIQERISAHAREFLKFSSFTRNEPSALPAVCDLIAAFLDESPLKVAKSTSDTARSIFKFY